jgi:hypothetical protein
MSLWIFYVLPISLFLFIDLRHFFDVDARYPPLSVPDSRKSKTTETPSIHTYMYVHKLEVIERHFIHYLIIEICQFIP